MARLDFALWDAVGGYSETSVPMADVYDEHIRLAQELEGLGYHSYFVIEHQNSPIGRITAPAVYLTAVARATSKLQDRRDDVAAAALSPDPPRAGGGDARPSVARAGRVRHRHRRPRA